MATIFWDTKGILLIDYLDKGQTITGEYYASLLRQLRIKIKSKRRGKLSKGVLLLQDNAPVHNAHVATTTARDCGYEILPHPPYSPDLAPSDFYLFPKLKSDLAGQRHISNSAVIEAVNAYFDEANSEFFLTGLMMLPKRWAKCISVNGSYVEK